MRASTTMWQGTVSHHISNKRQSGSAATPLTCPDGLPRTQRGRPAPTLRRTPPHPTVGSCADWKCVPGSRTRHEKWMSHQGQKKSPLHETRFSTPRASHNPDQKMLQTWPGIGVIREAAEVNMWTHRISAPVYQADIGLRKVFRTTPSHGARVELTFIANRDTVHLELHLAGKRNCAGNAIVHNSHIP